LGFSLVTKVDSAEKTSNNGGGKKGSFDTCLLKSKKKSTIVSVWQMWGRQKPREHSKLSSLKENAYAMRPCKKKRGQ